MPSCEIEIFLTKDQIHLIDIRNELGSILDLIRQLCSKLSNVEFLLPIFSKLGRNFTCKFNKIILKSCIDSLEKYITDKSTDLLNFNITLIRLALTDGISILDIQNDTGKNLRKAVYLKNHSE